MPSHLTKIEKAQCKVILALLVTSLLLQRVGQKVLDEETKADLPAVVECTKMIDEILGAAEQERRTLMVNKIQKTRIKLTKKVADFEISASLVGALSYLTSGQIKSRPGTRLDFIIQTFSANLEVLKNTVPEHSLTAKEFEKELGKAIQSI